MESFFPGVDESITIIEDGVLSLDFVLDEDDLEEADEIARLQAEREAEVAAAEAE
jgi:hypothetical protein